MLTPLPRRAMTAGLLALALSACARTGEVTEHAAASTEAASLTNAKPGTFAVIDGQRVPPPPIPMGDKATVARILDEGMHRNRVMDHLRYLTLKIGPRLTGSSNAEAANRWALEQFRSWGLAADLHQWDTVPLRFDRGPSTGKLLVRDPRKRRGADLPDAKDAKGPPDADKKDADKPADDWKPVRDFQFTTLCWTRGTDGPVRGPVIPLPETEDEYQKVKPRLKGAWILLDRLSTSRGMRLPAQVVAKRFTARMEARDKVAHGADPSTIDLEERVIFDGVAGFITAPDDQRDRVWTARAPDWDKRTLDQVPPDVEVVVRLCDHDNMRVRLAEGEEIQAEFDLKHTLTPGPIPVYNTIAEIRGSERPDEVVIIGAHCDSWNGPGSQGCTDNGTGTAVTLEAARILAAAHARPRRTIRFCLFTGEEQGLLGSKGYVASLSPEERAKISAVFVDDGGTDYEGGLHCTADMRDALAAATAPVNARFTDTHSGEPMTVNVKVEETFPRMSGSDHFSFIEAGVPGFFWDEVGRADYGWGWHTQHDTIDLAIPEYLQQSATCAAVTAYNLACAPDLLPRVPAPPKKDKPEDHKPEDKNGTPALKPTEPRA
jgi:hypothetical protein